jgi:hypothetical protein
VVDLLFSLLLSGAKLAASGATSEFGKVAFEAIKARLQGEHGVKSLPLLEEAESNPAFEGAIKADLAKPTIAADTELLKLGETLKASIEALPADTLARYAIDIKVIRSGGSLFFEGVEGIHADTATT